MDSVQDTITELKLMLQNQMTSFEARLEGSSNTSDTANIAADFAAFKTFTLSALNLLQRQIESVARDVDTMEMRGRRKILLFHGVQEQSSENTAEEVAAVVKKHLKIDTFVAADIARSHRMGRPSETRKPRPILVKFNKLPQRDSIWYGKTSLKSTGITLSEFLTKPRYEAFMAAREKYGVNKCWTKEGFVHVILSDGSRHRVVSLQELNSLKDPIDPSTEKTSEMPKTAINKRRRAALPKK